MGLDASQFTILVFLLAVFTDILLGSSDSFLFCLSVPIKIYENAYVQKAQILKENKGKENNEMKKTSSFNNLWELRGR